MKILIRSIFAIIIGCPLGWIDALISTPLLLSLEDKLHIELAGHSGPSDTIFIGSIALHILLIFSFLTLVDKKQQPKN